MADRSAVDELEANLLTQNEIMVCLVRVVSMLDVCVLECCESQDVHEILKMQSIISPQSTVNK